MTKRPTQRAKGQTTITISIPTDLRERIDALATRDDRKRSPYIVRLLEQAAEDVVVRLPETLVKRIDALAAAGHRTREQWIVMKLEEALQADKAGAPPPPASSRKSASEIVFNEKPEDPPSPKSTEDPPEVTGKTADLPELGPRNPVRYVATPKGAVFPKRTPAAKPPGK